LGLHVPDTQHALIVHFTKVTNMDTLILLGLNIGLPLLLFLVFFTSFKYIFEKRMQTKARTPKEYYVLLFLVAAGCSFSTFIGGFLAWNAILENSLPGLHGIITTMLLIVIVFIPIIVFVGAFFWVLRLLEKRIENLETATGNHYIVSLLVAALAGVISLLGVYLLAFTLTPDMTAVQAALDAQCGKELYVADPQGYSNDPYPDWIGYDGTVSCDNMFGDGWTCTCPTPITP
jgi:hypothetical protein